MQHKLPEIPLYQPGNTKALVLTLTEDEWFNLSAKCHSTNAGTLQDYIEGLLRKDANG